ncbi:hypothetical protein B0T19DRAFT_463710 [Cercophora scortea]|uniref:Uncharacterized protein n=1 Tax=Cercophora scortea TaxID=314031 RepID=A0AAE0M9G2_9PEZI|nr:hypothetical protein B0T19DRAFT_463710 [Cercophora scortea]
MKLSTLLAPLSLLLTAASADHAGEVAIEHALIAVRDSTLKLGSMFPLWNGQYEGTKKIVNQTTVVLNNIRAGTAAATAAAPLTILETLGVAQQVILLAEAVPLAMQQLIDARRKFAALELVPVILMTVELQKCATKDMSAAITAKVPSNLRDVAGTLVLPINKALDRAIAAYQP